MQTENKPRHQQLRHYIFPGLEMDLKNRRNKAIDRVLALTAPGTPTEHLKYNANVPPERRQHVGYTPQYLGRWLAENGIWVRTRVSFEPPLPSDSDFPGDARDPLLVIKTEPMPNQYFPYTHTTNLWATWHVSICYKSDGEQRHAYTDEDLSYLVHKFDNKELHLRFSRILSLIHISEPTRPY